MKLDTQLVFNQYASEVGARAVALDVEVVFVSIAHRIGLGNSNVGRALGVIQYQFLQLPSISATLICGSAFSEVSRSIF